MTLPKLSRLVMLCAGLTLTACHGGEDTACHSTPPHGGMAPGPGRTGPNGMGGMGSTGPMQHGARPHGVRHCGPAPAP